MAKIKVLFAASEVVPFAKTGGLADVSGSLPVALKKSGADIRVIMPKYATVKDPGDAGMLGKSVKVYFVENDAFFRRAGLYGENGVDYKDNLSRFAYFCREVLERMKREDFRPDIIHCNDWQTALISAYLNTLYAYDPFFKDTRTLFTIHNLAYQGVFAQAEYPKLGLDWSLFSVNYFEFYKKVNLMKAGIVYSNAISTVSPTYAEEIKTEEFGYGLEGVIRARSDVLYGIMNGIDDEVWDPTNDALIFKRYSRETLDDKYENKVRLEKELGLSAHKNIPLIGVISRLADQKGFDLLTVIIDELLAQDVHFVLLGTGDEKYHQQFARVAKRYPGKASIQLRFDAVLAQKIYAASDLFLIPSRYEPCGLGQMISFKYGTVPVVRLTGGLKDSVREFDPASGQGDGFTFQEYDARALLRAIQKGLSVYHHKDQWRDLVKKIMGYDFSWKRSAQEYLRLYARVR